MNSYVYFLKSKWKKKYRLQFLVVIGLYIFCIYGNVLDSNECIKTNIKNHLFIYKIYIVLD